MKKIDPTIERELCSYCRGDMGRKFDYDFEPVEMPSLTTPDVSRPAHMLTIPHRLETYTRGYYGHNVFCSLRCGYWWAMRELTDENPKQRVFSRA